MKGTIDIYGGHDPRDVATYTVPMAARYLRIPTPTLRNWVAGFTYETAAGKKRAERVIVPPHQVPHRRAIFLSFTNLVEAHVLASIRRVHEVPLPTVRRTLKYVETEFGTKHPLAVETFATSGKELFIQKLGKLISVSSAGQAEIRDAIEKGLARVEYVEGFARRLFPLSREPSDAPIESQPRLIVIDPRRSFGRPVIAGTGIPISEIKDRFLAGDSIEHLATDFRLAPALVEEALRAA